MPKIFLSHATAELTFATNITIFKASLAPDACHNHRCHERATTLDILVTLFISNEFQYQEQQSEEWDTPSLWHTLT